MKLQLVGTVVLLGALALASGCASESTPAVPKDGGASGGAGGSPTATGSGGSGGASTGGASGSGGLIAGTGGAVGTDAGSGGSGGAGGSPADGGADDGGAPDVAADTAGTEDAPPADAPVEQMPDDGAFPPNGPIGSCDPLNWKTSASNSAGNNPPVNAIDGLLSTRWSTGTAQATGEYYEIDF
ncbi:MAG TPA: hypothetical protein VNO55_29935, partial [Polyangia bacterium]|nr:hypothetical protein [Polyangia bacterium]